MTSLLHCYLRETNAFQLPIKPHFTSKKVEWGDGEGLAPSIPPLFCRNGPIWFFFVFQDLVPNDVPTSLLFVWNQRISDHQAPLHLKKMDWGEEEGLAPSIPPFFLHKWSLLRLGPQWPPYFIAICVKPTHFSYPSSPTSPQKNGLGGGGKDLRHLFHLFFCINGPKFLFLVYF